MAKKVLVLGGNFGGLYSAIAIKHDLGDDVDVTVISATDQFVFNPSLIWLPFGKRSPEDVTFPLDPTFDDNEVNFIHDSVTGFDLDARTVQTASMSYDYDYLVIATGYRNVFDIPGLGPDGNSYNITTLEDAIHAGEGWTKFLDDPGDVVIGASQGAGCFGAAYEFLFNFSYQVKKAGLADRVKITYVTSEPFLGHFGIGGLPHGESLLGKFLDHSDIGSHVSVAIDHVDAGRVVLDDGTALDNKYTMIIPPFWGQEFLAGTEIANDKGYVQVRDTYQTETRDEVYAVGIAADVGSPWQTPVPVGIPKTGFPTERMAHVAAKNIGSQVRGEEPTASEKFEDMAAICVLDAGNNGVMILADKMLPPRKHGVLIPGPQSHAAKLAFEKYFLWKSRHGYVNLP